MDYYSEYFEVDTLNTSKTASAVIGTLRETLPLETLPMEYLRYCTVTTVHSSFQLNSPTLWRCMNLIIFDHIPRVLTKRWKI